MPGNPEPRGKSQRSKHSGRRPRDKGGRANRELAHVIYLCMSKEPDWVTKNHLAIKLYAWEGFEDQEIAIKVGLPIEKIQHWRAFDGHDGWPYSPSEIMNRLSVKPSSATTVHNALEWLTGQKLVEKIGRGEYRVVGENRQGPTNKRKSRATADYAALLLDEIGAPIIWEQEWDDKNWGPIQTCVRIYGLAEGEDARVCADLQGKLIPLIGEVMSAMVKMKLDSTLASLRALTEKVLASPPFSSDADVERLLNWYLPSLLTWLGFARIADRHLEEHTVNRYGDLLGEEKLRVFKETGELREADSKTQDRLVLQAMDETARGTKLILRGLRHADEMTEWKSFEGRIKGATKGSLASLLMEWTTRHLSDKEEKKLINQLYRAGLKAGKIELFCSRKRIIDFLDHPTVVLTSECYVTEHSPSAILHRRALRQRAIEMTSRSAPDPVS